MGKRDKEKHIFGDVEGTGIGIITGEHLDLLKKTFGDANPNVLIKEVVILRKKVKKQEKEIKEIKQVLAGKGLMDG